MSQENNKQEKQGMFSWIGSFFKPNENKIVKKDEEKKQDLSHRNKQDLRKLQDPDFVKHQSESVKMQQERRFFNQHQQKPSHVSNKRPKDNIKERFAPRQY